MTGPVSAVGELIERFEEWASHAVGTAIDYVSDQAPTAQWQSAGDSLFLSGKVDRTETAKIALKNVEFGRAWFELHYGASAPALEEAGVALDVPFKCLDLEKFVADPNSSVGYLAQQVAANDLATSHERVESRTRAVVCDAGVAFLHGVRQAQAEHQPSTPKSNPRIGELFEKLQAAKAEYMALQKSYAEKL